MSKTPEQYRERLASTAWGQAWSIYMHRDGAQFVEQQCLPNMVKAVAAQVLRDVIAELDARNLCDPQGHSAYPADILDSFAAERGIDLGETS